MAGTATKPKTDKKIEPVLYRGWKNEGCREGLADEDKDRIDAWHAAAEPAKKALAAPLLKAGWEWIGESRPSEPGTPPTGAAANPADEHALAAHKAKVGRDREAEAQRKDEIAKKLAELGQEIESLEAQAKWVTSKEAEHVIAAHVRDLEREIGHICNIVWLDDDQAKDMRAIDRLRSIVGEKQSTIRRLKGAEVLEKLKAAREERAKVVKDVPLFAKAPSNGARLSDDAAAAIIDGLKPTLEPVIAKAAAEAAAEKRQPMNEATAKLIALVAEPIPAAPRPYDGPPLTPELHVDLGNAGFVWRGPANPKADEKAVSGALTVWRDATKKNQKKATTEAEDVLAAFGWRKA